MMLSCTQSIASPAKQQKVHPMYLSQSIKRLIQVFVLIYSALSRQRCGAEQTRRYPSEVDLFRIGDRVFLRVTVPRHLSCTLNNINNDK